jgi:soluble lytic murein transglycosylase
MERCAHLGRIYRRRLSSSAFVVSLLLFLLSPTQLIDEIDKARAKNLHEMSDIYTVLKSRDMDMSEASLWNLAGSILEESKKHALDPMLVLAVIQVESGFNHGAVSPRGAQGLMQIHPVAVTAVAEWQESPNLSKEKNLQDPVINVKIGVAYLSQLKKTFDDLKLALAAYNLGPTRVKKKLVSKEKIPFAYAGKVLSAQRLLEKRGRSERTLSAKRTTGSRDVTDAHGSAIRSENFQTQNLPLISSSL